MDALAFERWFNDPDAEVNPRIEMVQDIIDEMAQPYRTYLEEYFYERLSMREISKRHNLGPTGRNPWHAHQKVHSAMELFKQIWIERHGAIT
jgi:hypothetical protein